MMKELTTYQKEEEEPVSFRKQIEPMTRAEWVRQARAECEKELEYYEELRRRAEQMNGEVEETGEEAEVKDEEVFTGHCRYIDLSGGYDEHSEEEREYCDRLAEEKEADWEKQTIYRPSFQISNLSKFTVRLVAAAIIALVIITLDYFNLQAGVLDPERIESAILKNDTIESVEDSVTAFTRDKVMPIFGKD